MRVLVVNGFVREAVGDAALLSVLLEQIDAAFPGCEMQIASLEDPRLHQHFEGRRNLGSCRRYGADEQVARPRRAIRKLLVAGLSRWWFTGPVDKYRWLAKLLPAEVRAEVQAILGADLVVSVGGGYLNGPGHISGDLSVISTLLPIRLAGRLGKPVICAPQSFGPFGTDRQHRSARTALRDVDLVVAREDPSLHLLLALGLDRASVRRGVDSAFAFAPGDPSGWRERLGLDPDDVVVGMTARRWLDAADRERYERVLAQLVDHVQKQPGRHVVLVPHVISRLSGEDDRISHRRIAGYCSGRTPVVIEEFHDHVALKGLYGALDYVVGMRFHSVIFALTSHVPSIAIEYHHKAGGIMADLGLEDWVVPLDEVAADRLAALFDRMVRERGAYLQHLRECLPAYMDRARETQELIRTAFEDHGAVASALPGAAGSTATGRPADDSVRRVSPSRLRFVAAGRRED